VKNKGNPQIGQITQITDEYMKKRISILPTLITLGNIVCGFAAIVYASEGEFALAARLILLAMVFDALDGQVARMTKTAGEFGGELDSLCDVVSFGLAPAVLINRMAMLPGRPFMPEQIVWLFSAVYVACAALRLARFNTETGAEDEEHEGFIGLPSPAAAGTISTLVIFDAWLGGNPIAPFIPLAGLVTGALMISRVEYVHMGNRLFKERRRFRDFVQLMVLGVLVALRWEIGLTSLFVCYTGYGIVKHVIENFQPAAFAANEKK